MIQLINVSQANDAGINFVIQGDGVETVFKAALNKDPFNMSFNNLPSGLSLTLGDPDLGTAVAALSTVGADTILTVTFDQAPPADETLGLPIVPVWNSLT